MTNVPRFDAKAEESIVETIRGMDFERVLVASDLHLCTGQDRETGVFKITENFYADEVFRSWLAYYGGYSGLLVLNGDIFDFVRVTDVPTARSDFTRWNLRMAELGDVRTPARTLSRTERIYGLRTDDYKTLWKLMRIIDGHPQFFDALAQWLAESGSILWLKGNHDLEMHWPLIRRALRDELTRRGAELDDVVQRMGYVDDNVIVRNLYIEHGHKYEDMTRVDGPPVLRKDQSQINLPLGSFVNRYFINKMERLDAFLDNTKPVQQAMIALLRRHPIEIVGTYIRAWRFLRRAIFDMRRFNRAVGLILIALLLPFMVPLVIALTPAVWASVQRVLPFGPIGDTIVGGLSGTIMTAMLPYLVGACTEILRRFQKPRDHLAEAGAAALVLRFQGGMQRYYAVMGHTHVQACKLLPLRGREGFYVNSGTWIALWPRERRDLIGHVHYTYLEFRQMNDEFRHQSQEWNEHAGRPRSARILVNAGTS